MKEQQPMKAIIEHNGAKIEISCTDHSLCDMLQLVEQALRGCGFMFDGQLDIVKDE